MTMSTTRHVANCGRCGRFVGPRNFNAVYDEYRCNREWAGCPAHVLVAERALRLIAADAIDERIDLPPGPRQPNGNCVVTGPGPGGTRADGSLIDPEDGETDE